MESNKLFDVRPLQRIRPGRRGRGQFAPVVLVLSSLIAAGPAAGQQKDRYDYFGHNREMIQAGVQAVLMCNGLFTSHRTLEQVFDQELAYLRRPIGSARGGDYEVDAEYEEGEEGDDEEWEEGEEDGEEGGGDEDFGPSWAVYVTMEMIADHARIVALQRTFTQLAEPHGGACDGWGALA